MIAEQKKEDENLRFQLEDTQNHNAEVKIIHHRKKKIKMTKSAIRREMSFLTLTQFCATQTFLR